MSKIDTGINPNDYELIRDKDIPKHFLRFVIMSLFWRYD